MIQYKLDNSISYNDDFSNSCSTWKNALDKYYKETIKKINSYKLEKEIPDSFLYTHDLYYEYPYNFAKSIKAQTNVNYYVCDSKITSTLEETESVLQSTGSIISAILEFIVSNKIFGSYCVLYQIICKYPNNIYFELNLEIIGDNKLEVFTLSFDDEVIYADYKNALHNSYSMFDHIAVVSKIRKLIKIT